MGSVKTFKLNQVNSGDTFDFTTASEDASSLLYDREFNNQLASVASADGTNEKIKVTFDMPQDISAVGLMNHNIKTGNIKYLDSGLNERGLSTGSELLINGEFTSDVADWGVLGTVGLTWDSGQASVDTTSTGGIRQNIITEIGKTYYIEGLINSMTSSAVGLRAGTGGSLLDIYISSAGVVGGYFTATGTLTEAYGRNGSAGITLWEYIRVSEAVAYFSDNTDTNSFFDTFTEVTDAYGIVVNCTYTQDAGEKKIGQLLSLESLYSFDSAKRLLPKLKIQQEFNTKSDGGLDKIINGVKHNGQIKFDNLDNDDVDNLFSLAVYPDPFWIYLAGLSDNNLKQFFKVDDIYLVNMTNEPYPQMPSGLVDSIGWVDKIDYSEV